MRYVQNPNPPYNLIPAQDYYSAPNDAPIVVPDVEGYQSPVTGLWVEGRKARREDLKRSGCRPWEGREQEEKEAARQRAYTARKADAELHESVAKAFHQISPESRRTLERYL